MSKDFTDLASVTVNQTGHDKIHNDDRTRLAALDGAKQNAKDVWGMIPEWRIDYDEKNKTWPARNVPDGFQTAFPNKRVVWASAANQGTPPGIQNGDYVEYYEST